MEALVDSAVSSISLKRDSRKRKPSNSPDGSIPSVPGATWICSTGMAQLAIAWLKLGRREPATKAVRYLERSRHPSGGFFGSYGKGAIYFTKEEISWAVKFFIDAELLAAPPA